MPILAAFLAAAPAAALEGAPPFAWLPSGASLPELQGEVSLAADVGSGAGFAGASGPRSLRADRYLVAPVQARYGLWGGIEGYVIGPFVWGSAEEEYVDARTGGAPFTNRARLSGFDGGDPEVGLRWAVVSAERGEESAFEVIVAAGMVLPWGTGVWQMSQYNYVTGPAAPDFASGSGAWQVAGALEVRAGTGRWRLDTLVGYLRALAQEATAMEPPGSTIEVTVPSPAMVRLEPALRLGDSLWLTGRVEGFAAPRGTIKVGGHLARSPGSTEAVMDSYRNLVDPSSGLWAGAGIRWDASESVGLAAGVAAPVVTNGLYRMWRAGLTVSWAYKP